MREVLLVRHGKAVAAAPGGDAARPLTDEGRAGIEAVARGLAAFGVAPDAVWHSPYVRAAETAAIVAGALGCREVVADGALTPVASPERAAQAILEATARTLLCVSHMPLLPALCLELVGARVDFGTGTVAHVVALGPLGSAPLERGRSLRSLIGLWSAEQLALVR